MASPHTTNTGQIVKPSESQSLQQMLKTMGPQLAKALPRHVTPDRMSRMVMTALKATPKLQKCTPVSFFGSVLQAAQLGLEPNTPLGQCYLLPFENRKRGIVECSLIIGYKGMVDLARRAGASVIGEAVHDGDEFVWQLGTRPLIQHKPLAKIGAPLTHVYAVARVKDVEPAFKVLTVAQVEQHRARSRSKDSGPWVTDYEPMAIKTAVRVLAPWMPQSPELARAVALDEATERLGSVTTALDDTIGGALLDVGIADEADLVDVEGESRDRSEREPGEDG